MSKLPVKILFTLGVIFLAVTASATNDSASKDTSIKKDEWLKKLKTVSPRIICKSFLEEAAIKKKFEELKMTKEKCISLIPTSYDKCQSQYYSNIPDTIDQKDASKWGNTLGECIGSDFAAKHLINPQSMDTKDQVTNTTMSKDQWLSQLRTFAPEMICKGFLEDNELKKKFAERHIDNAKCLTLIPSSFDKCKVQYYSSLPATIDAQSASQWGHKIGECIGGDFAVQHLINKI